MLVNWWSRHSYGRHCYIGLGIYKAGSNARWRDRNIIPMQIRDARSYSTIQGQVYFSSKSFLKNPNGWNDSLQQHYYKYPALIPPMPWIDSIAPRPPVINAVSSEGKGTEQQVNISATYIDTDKKLRQFALYVFSSLENTDISGKAPLQVIPSTTDSVDCVLALSFLPKPLVSGNELYIGITAVDINNVESELSILQKLERPNGKSDWEIMQ